MGAARKLKTDKKEIREQISSFKQEVRGSVPQLFISYILDMDISTADDITIDDAYEYREYIDTLELSDRQKKYYQSIMEQFVYRTCIREYHELKFPENIMPHEIAACRKIFSFLILNNIRSPADMDYELRENFLMYTQGKVTDPKMRNEKMFDRIKLDWIKREMEEHPQFCRKLKYENKKIYLLYHPDYELAMSFYYVQDKTGLVFDFSADASEKMKRQIFKMLQHVLENIKEKQDRRGKCLFPLIAFYKFCVTNGIDDIEQMMAKQKDAYEKRMKEEGRINLDLYKSIVNNTRKYLFLTADETNWNATIWFLERFSFDISRVNNAREVWTLRFDKIENEKSRALMQEYFKYLIGVAAHLSVISIREKFNNIWQFVSFLESTYGIAIYEIETEHMEAYVRYLNKKDISWDYYNLLLIDLGSFLRYASIRHGEVPVFDKLSYFFKTGVNKHNDRIVSLEVQQLILAKLKDAPHMLRLMYMLLWSTGIRVSEVCTVKRNAFSYDGSNAWLRVYQPKMKAEKMIPIPYMVYKLISSYISKTDGDQDDFVFKSAKGRAYDAGTFTKQIKQILSDADLNNYEFKAHDFRHTIATRMHREGASIEAIRDYLGHRDSDMTRRYIDYVQREIDELNEQLFNKGGN